MPTPLPPSFPDYRPLAPDDDHIRRAYADFMTRARGTDPDVADIVRGWDGLRREIASWTAWVSLRFRQDTRDAGRKADRERGDATMALVNELDADLKRALLGDGLVDRTRAAVGDTVAALWGADHRAYHPSVTEDVMEEDRVVAEYVERIAGGSVPFEGRDWSLVTLGKPCIDENRSRREAANRARWGWWNANREVLDAIFGRLVALRARQAETLGLPDYTALGYLRMQRVDYDRVDVERFRAGVRDSVVPLVAELRVRQAERLGIPKVMAWDEAIGDPEGIPLLGGEAGLAEAGRRAFSDLDPDLADFYAWMVDSGWVDLGSRDGKSGGGFCTFMGDVRSPFVFCAGNGSHTDVRTLVHEMGHAFQCWSSREQALQEIVFPTYEAAEIHSMGLEFLAWPAMEHFFGEATDRWRRDHLERALSFLPYGTAVDHFQHLVYARPDATPADRHAMWKEMEATYLPWRDYGDMPHVTDGAFWQVQRHIYARPFYYIDYVLAQTCALQLWSRSQSDEAGTMRSYKALCALGGSLPFQALCRSAGLRSPLDEGCVADVVAVAEQWLADWD